MSSNVPPQLHLDLPSNASTVSFKRSFEQSLGLSLDDNPANGELRSGNAVGDGNDRHKRARSAASTSSSSPSASSSTRDGSPGVDSARSRDPSPLLSMPLSALSATRPVFDTTRPAFDTTNSDEMEIDLERPPRLPTPIIESDIEIPAVILDGDDDRELSPGIPLPTSEDSLYNRTLSHFLDFESEISTLRASPPPTLPPINIHNGSVSDIISLLPDSGSPHSSSLRNSSTTEHEEPLQESESGRSRRAFDRFPPRVDLPTTRLPSLTLNDVRPFHGHLNAALDVIRSSSPLLQPPSPIRSSYRSISPVLSDTRPEVSASRTEGSVPRQRAHGHVRDPERSGPASGSTSANFSRTDSQSPFSSVARLPAFRLDTSISPVDSDSGDDVLYPRMDEGGSFDAGPFPAWRMVGSRVTHLTESERTSGGSPTRRYDFPPPRRSAASSRRGVVEERAEPQRHPFRNASDLLSARRDSHDIDWFDIPPITPQWRRVRQQNTSESRMLPSFFTMFPETDFASVHETQGRTSPQPSQESAWSTLDRDQTRPGRASVSRGVPADTHRRNQLHLNNATIPGGGNSLMAEAAAAYRQMMDYEDAVESAHPRNSVPMVRRRSTTSSSTDYAVPAHFSSARSFLDGRESQRRDRPQDRFIGDLPPRAPANAPPRLTESARSGLRDIRGLFLDEDFITTLVNDADEFDAFFETRRREEFNSGSNVTSARTSDAPRLPDDLVPTSEPFPDPTHFTFSGGPDSETLRSDSEFAHIYDDDGSRRATGFTNARLNEPRFVVRAAAEQPPIRSRRRHASTSLAAEHGTTVDYPPVSPFLAEFDFQSLDSLERPTSTPATGVFPVEDSGQGYRRSGLRRSVADGPDASSATTAASGRGEPRRPYFLDREYHRVRRRASITDALHLSRAVDGPPALRPVEHEPPAAPSSINPQHFMSGPARSTIQRIAEDLERQRTDLGLSFPRNRASYVGSSASTAAPSSLAPRASDGFPRRHVDTILPPFPFDGIESDEEDNVNVQQALLDYYTSRTASARASSSWSSTLRATLHRQDPTSRVESRSSSEQHESRRPRPGHSMVYPPDDNETRRDSDRIPGLHEFLSRRPRIAASRIEDFTDPPALSHTAAPSGRDNGFTDAIDVLRQDGLSRMRSQQLISAYHRERSDSSSADPISAYGRLNSLLMERGARERSSRGSGRSDRDTPASRQSDALEATARRLRLRRSYLPRRTFLGDYVRDEDFDQSYEGLLRLSAALGEARPLGIPEETISGMEYAKYKDWANADSDTRCPICLDDYNSTDMVMKLPDCPHWLHKECLHQWLKGANTCPVCRKAVQRPVRRESAAQPLPRREPPSQPRRPIQTASAFRDLGYIPPHVIRPPSTSAPGLRVPDPSPPRYPQPEMYGPWELFGPSNPSSGSRRRRPNTVRPGRRTSSRLDRHETTFDEFSGSSASSLTREDEDDADWSYDWADTDPTVW